MNTAKTKIQEQRFRLVNRDVAKNAMRAIGALFGEGESTEPLMEVLIREHKSNRSLAQNRLSHRWYGERAKHQGTTPEYEHRVCKLRYGCPIMIAADEDFAIYYRRAIEPLDYEQRIAAMKFMPVTRLMGVRQMAIYLTDVERDSHAHGIPLSHPDDLYWEAMGR